MCRALPLWPKLPHSCSGSLKPTLTCFHLSSLLDRDDSTRYSPLLWHHSLFHQDSWSVISQTGDYVPSRSYASSSIIVRCFESTRSMGVHVTILLLVILSGRFSQLCTEMFIYLSLPTSYFPLYLVTFKSDVSILPTTLIYMSIWVNRVFLTPQNNTQRACTGCHLVNITVQNGPKNSFLNQAFKYSILITTYFTPIIVRHFSFLLLSFAWAPEMQYTQYRTLSIWARGPLWIVVRERSIWCTAYEDGSI